MSLSRLPACPRRGPAVPVAPSWICLILHAHSRRFPSLVTEYIQRYSLERVFFFFFFFKMSLSLVFRFSSFFFPRLIMIFFSFDFFFFFFPFFFFSRRLLRKSKEGFELKVGRRIVGLEAAFAFSWPRCFRLPRPNFSGP